MKLSTRGRYGTRALLDLALYQVERPVLLKDIAQRQQIPLHYLEHLIGPLITGGIIRTARGAKGGVSLNKPPQEVSLSEIIQLLEGPIFLVDCVNNPGICNRSKSCAVRDTWDELTQAMDNVLKSTTLQDLLERQRAKEQPENRIYPDFSCGLC